MVPLLLVAAARLVAWDARPLLVALNALTPLLFLPAWPVAVAAGLARRWALLVGATGACLAHVAFLAPELAAREPLPALARETVHLRLYSANVWRGNDQVDAQAEEIAGSRPDVAFLQEATPEFLAGLDRTGALEELPHRVVVARTDPFAAVLASRWPLVDQGVVEVDGRPVLVRATTEAPEGPVRIYGVHVVAPVGGSRPQWIKELRAVEDAVGGERVPVLVAGDFNATWSHRAFRRLLDAGLTDAAAARGRPLQMTWPRHWPLVPPLARIDHVLTTDGLAVTGIRTGRGSGSDHRPLVADVARTRMPSAQAG